MRRRQALGSFWTKSPLVGESGSSSIAVSGQKWLEVYDRNWHIAAP